MHTITHKLFYGYLMIAIAIKHNVGVMSLLLYLWEWAKMPIENNMSLMAKLDCFY